ncbi:MAG TPA: hypothetical protein VHM28_09200, partial [Anaerolineales bacterium]|nr:hypothetical protein [Anaerolineales bacterium]
MVKTKNFIPIVLLGALPAMMLLLHGYIGSFTRYIADDYCSAYWAERFGLLRSVWHWYITWSGRFSAYASDWFIMLIGARNVRFIPPIVLILWLAITTFALYLYVRRILSKENAFGLSLLLSVVFIFSMLLLSPNIQQSFFWWNGMRSYNLPLIFLTLFALVFQLASEKLTTVKSIVLGSLFTLVFFFLNAGLSDTFAVAQFTLLGILIFLWLINPEHRKADLAIPSAGLLGTALAIIVIILSP